MPPESTQNQAPKGKRSVIVLVIAAAVLVIIAYLMLKGPQPQEQGVQQTPEITREKVNVKNVNLAAANTPESKLPEGFPRDIPVELTEVVESYSADYVEKGLVQYTVSFMSSKNVKEKYKEYEDYMTKAGYTFGPTSKDSEHNYLYGRKGNDDLSVTVSLRAGRAFVQLSYINRE